MAATTIDNLPANTALSGTEQLPASQTLITKRVSTQALKTYVQGSVAKLADIATAVPIVEADFTANDTIYLYSLALGGNLPVTLPNVATYTGAGIKLLIQTDIVGLQYTVGVGAGAGKFMDGTLSKVFTAEATTLRVINNHWVVV